MEKEMEEENVVPRSDERPVVGVRLIDRRGVGDMDPRDLILKIGDMVIVEADKGIGLGRVVYSKRKVVGGSYMPKVLRRATRDDLQRRERNLRKEVEAFEFCRERIEKAGLPMRLVKATYLYDGSKVTFYFTADGRVDFRALVKELAQKFYTRIEMKQVGVRDEAKILGGIAPCGRALCCSSFLMNFEPVSVRMAKDQNLALDPTKVSGVCGRLMCCLGYEHACYRELKKGMPKKGKKIRIDERLVIVCGLNVLEQRVSLFEHGQGEHSMSLEKFKVFMEKAAAGESPAIAGDPPPRPVVTPEAPPATRRERIGDSAKAKAPAARPRGERQKGERRAPRKKTPPAKGAAPGGGKEKLPPRSETTDPSKPAGKGRSKRRGRSRGKRGAEAREPGKGSATPPASSSSPSSGALPPPPAPGRPAEGQGGEKPPRRRRRRRRGKGSGGGGGSKDGG